MSMLLTVTGSVLIMHAAYSCLHFRFVVQDLEASEGFASDAPATAIPPTDVWMECCAAFLLILLGELSRKGSHLQPVVPRKGAPKNTPLMAPAYRTRDFDIYTSRGCAL